MFRASKHDSTFQKTRFDILFKEAKKRKDLKCVELNSKNIFGSKKSEILMFRASKHDSTFQKTRFNISKNRIQHFF